MKVKKSGHMPVREGKMDCTTCHSPHGSNNVRMLKTGNTLNEMCASCHAEKRGPFLLGSRRRPRELRELPRSARLEQRPHAGREGADALPAVPRQQPASGDDLRRHADRGGQQPRRRPELRELPLADSRVEPSGGRQVPSVAQEDVMRTNIADDGCRAPADRQEARPRRTTSTTAAQPDVAKTVTAVIGRPAGQPDRHRRSRDRLRVGLRSGADTSAIAICATAARSIGSGSSRTPTRTGSTCRPITSATAISASSGIYTNYGKVKASFEWNQIPLFYSKDTRTLYDTSTPGTLTLNDGVQSGIQNKTLDARQPR